MTDVTWEHMRQSLAAALSGLDHAEIQAEQLQTHVAKVKDGIAEARERVDEMLQAACEGSIREDINDLLYRAEQVTRAANTAEIDAPGR